MASSEAFKHPSGTAGLRVVIIKPSVFTFYALTHSHTHTYTEATSLKSTSVIEASQQRTIQTFKLNQMYLDSFNYSSLFGLMI